ncbi:hypothetical protein O6H91_05G064000 [Diphasiastrum complanatum]|uniref:Uncharacterized protein n=2 Tax=Diphasiastrum complanatum TaxID=34168 RepID=A0ACC2DPQ8_DIPCM|nr:hypothetical protein O6H91_05G064000 [Diphasiastrum complanatum]KAJ7555978.1 hypothetical protein O6H91_05G064000 [Diphasiastrum complanatum]
MEISDFRLKVIAHTDLIPGLPDDVVLNCILPRLAWTSFPSLLRVSKSWNAAFASRRIGDIRRMNPSFQERLLAVIHKTTSRPLDEHPDEISSCPWIMDTPLDEHPEEIYSCPWIMDINLAVSIYDPILCVWEELPPIPYIPYGAPMFTRCICVDGKLFVLGGCNSENWEPVQDVYRMDLATGLRKWEKCAGMNTARANFACTCYEGKIFVAGGYGRDGLVSSTAELYDVQKEEWLPLPDLNIPRSDCLGAVLNKQIHVIGGYTSLVYDLRDQDEPDSLSSNCVSSMEILDKQCKGWISTTTSTVAPLQAFAVSSGQLCPLTDGAMHKFNDDLTSGKPAMEGMLISHFSLEEDDDETYLALAAVSLQQEIYAIIRDTISCFGSGFSFCKGKKDKTCAQGTVVTWQPIECPFEIVELALSCCSVSV